MNADDPITINHVDTTPFAAVVNVLYNVISILESQTEDKTKKLCLYELRDVLNKLF